VLESLEVRLALSSVPAAAVPLDLNPQPLPPGVVVKHNPVVPAIQGQHIGTSAATAADITIRKSAGSQIVVAKPVLNPQPLPPGNKANPPTGMSVESASPSDDWLVGSVVVPKGALGADHNGTHQPPGTFSPDPTCGNCIMAVSAYSVTPQADATGAGSGKVS
jgi:hypothetical protein